MTKNYFSHVKIYMNLSSAFDFKLLMNICRNRRPQIYSAVKNSFEVFDNFYDVKLL